MFSDSAWQNIRKAAEYAAKYKPLLDDAAKQVQALQHRMPPLKELERLAKNARKAADYPRQQLIRSFTFARGGWHDAPLLHMVAGTLEQIVDELVGKPDDEVKATLDREIPLYFRSKECEPLVDMVDRWHMYPEWRQTVFEDTVGAHKQGLYTLSVPALAPQIEGMLRYETGEYGRGSGWLKTVNKTLGFEYNHASPPSAITVDDLNEAIKALEEKDLPERHALVDRVDLEHALWRVNELYNKGDFTDPDFVNSTNRHGILHGVAEDFDELASIKLFCAVELAHHVVLAYREQLKPTTSLDSDEDEC